MGGDRRDRSHCARALSKNNSRKCGKQYRGKYIEEKIFENIEIYGLIYVKRFN